MPDSQEIRANQATKDRLVTLGPQAKQVNLDSRDSLAWTQRTARLCLVPKVLQVHQDSQVNLGSPDSQAKKGQPVRPDRQEQPVFQAHQGQMGIQEVLALPVCQDMMRLIVLVLRVQRPFVDRRSDL